MDDDVFKELLGDFLLESRERLMLIESIALDLPTMSSDEEAARFEDLKRQLHTLKGNSGMMGFEGLQDLAHQLEDEVNGLRTAGADVDGFLAGIDRCRGILDTLEPEPVSDDAAAAAAEKGAGVESSVRVPLSRLRLLADLASELVISRNRLARSIEFGFGRDRRDPFWKAAREAHREQERLLDTLQHEVLGLRMIPLRNLVGGLRRMVHDEAQRVGKSVRLQSRGEETPLDRSLVEFAGDALGHLVRNAVVHGIESPELRERLGKPPEGVVLIQAGVRSGGVEIEVLDDGGGVDTKALREAAEVAGIESVEGSGSELAFLPGVTTHAEADLSAGRGMGLAAVVEEAHRRGAELAVESLEKVGTRFILRLPLSVAVARALLVTADGEKYAIPVASITETLSLNWASTSGAAVGAVEWRGRDLPLLDLGRIFGTSAGSSPRSFAVVVEAEGRAAALTVDSPGELREIVVKRLDRVAGSPPGVAGSTVLGDGRVVLILDPTDLTLLPSDPGRMTENIT